MSLGPPKSSLLPPQLNSHSSTLPIVGQSKSAVTLRWIKICHANEVSIEGLYPYDVTREHHKYPLLIIRTHAGLYALRDECPHRRVPLSESGYLNGEVVHCGHHHWGFNVQTGSHTIPTGICVDRFDVKIEESHIWVAIP